MRRAATAAAAFFFASNSASGSRLGFGLLEREEPDDDVDELELDLIWITLLSILDGWKQARIQVLVLGRGTNILGGGTKFFTGVPP